MPLRSLQQLRLKNGSRAGTVDNAVDRFIVGDRLDNTARNEEGSTAIVAYFLRTFADAEGGSQFDTVEHALAPLALRRDPWPARRRSRSPTTIVGVSAPETSLSCSSGLSRMRSPIAPQRL